MKNCTIIGCDLKHMGVGFCQKHYQRFKKHGDPNKVDNFYREDEKRFLSHVKIIDSGCWEWQGRISNKGYAHFFWDKSTKNAHRFSYKQYVGPLTKGLQIDHLCRNKTCVNPSHLEQVTQQVNISRIPRHTKTHCKKGHEYTPENSYFYKETKRCCRICLRLKNQKRRI